MQEKETKMKIKLITIASALFLSTSIYAADNKTQEQLQSEITALSNKVNAMQPSTKSYITTGKVGGDFVANAGDQNRAYGILQLLQNSKSQPTINIGLDTQINALWGQRTSNDSIGPNDNYDATKKSITKTYINDAKIVLLANANNYIHFQTRFGVINPIDQESDQTMQLEDATIFFGDLNKTPFYASAGQEYINFGIYNEGWFPTDSLSKQLFFTGSLPEALVGYAAHGLNITISAYQRDTSANIPNNPAFASQIQYEYDLGDNNITVGAGIITDERGTRSGIAGLIDTNGAKTNNKPNRNGSLPALDLNAGFTYQNFDMYVEYNKLLKSVQINSNNSKTNISVVSTQFDYVIQTSKPITLSAGYSESFGLGYIDSQNTTPWNNSVKNMAQAGVDVQATDNIDVGLENTYAREYTDVNKVNSVNTVTLLVHAIF
jgi:hypothetical protein